jgi:hypothetical protein
VISEIRLRYFDGCPNWTTAEARVREAIRSSDSGDRTRIVLERVETDDEAQRLGFLGSPTILLDGVDPFSVEQSSFGLTCRLYKTEGGFEGSPSVDQLRRALQDSLVGRPSDLRGGLPLTSPCEDCDEVAAEGQRDSRTVRAVRNAAFRLLLATGAPVSSQRSLLARAFLKVRWEMRSEPSRLAAGRSATRSTGSSRVEG